MKLRDKVTYPEHGSQIVISESEWNVWHVQPLWSHFPTRPRNHTCPASRPVHNSTTSSRLHPVVASGYSPSTSTSSPTFIWGVVDSVCGGDCGWRHTTGDSVCDWFVRNVCWLKHTMTTILTRWTFLHLCLWSNRFFLDFNLWSANFSSLRLLIWPFFQTF